MIFDRLRRQKLEERLRSLEERLTKIEMVASKPCIYEMRTRDWWGTDAPASVWCQTHGWDCPNQWKKTGGGFSQ